MDKFHGSSPNFQKRLISIVMQPGLTLATPSLRTDQVPCNLQGIFSSLPAMEHPSFEAANHCALNTLIDIPGC
jgi:hypothetical protein